MAAGTKMKSLLVDQVVLPVECLKAAELVLKYSMT